MTSNAKNAGFLRAAGLGALFLLGACAEAPEPSDAVKARETLAPALLPPAEVADPDEPPSYEVGIATAAADRNHAKEECADMPKPERETCEAAANASFSTAESGLNDLRGNQQ